MVGEMIPDISHPLSSVTVTVYTAAGTGGAALYAEELVIVLVKVPVLPPGMLPDDGLTVISALDAVELQEYV